MAEKRRDPSEIIATHAKKDDQGRIDVELSPKILQNQALMLQLHHHTVDLLAKKRLLVFFNYDVEKRLATLGTVIVSDFISSTLRHCQAAVEQAEASKAKGTRGAGSKAKSPPPKRA